MQDNVCSICLNKKSNKLIKCKYCNNEFDQDCLNKWLKKGNNCPLCRNILNDNSELDNFDDEEFIILNEVDMVSAFLNYYKSIFFDILIYIFQIYFFSFLIIKVILYLLDWA